MALDKTKLLDLKDSIEEAKMEVSKLTGKKEHLMTQLKETYGCASIKDAEAKVEKMAKDISKLETQIATGIADLEGKYNIEE